MLRHLGWPGSTCMCRNSGGQVPDRFKRCRAAVGRFGDRFPLVIGRSIRDEGRKMGLLIRHQGRKEGRRRGPNLRHGPLSLSPIGPAKQRRTWRLPAGQTCRSFSGICEFSWQNDTFWGSLAHEKWQLTRKMIKCRTLNVEPQKYEEGLPQMCIVIGS